MLSGIAFPLEDEVVFLVYDPENPEVLSVAVFVAGQDMPVHVFDLPLATVQLFLGGL